MRESIGNIEAKLTETFGVLTELKQMMAKLEKDSFEIKGTNYEGMEYILKCILVQYFGFL